MPILVVDVIDPNISPGGGTGTVIGISDYAEHQIKRLLGGEPKGWLDGRHRDTLVELAGVTRDSEISQVIDRIDQSGRAWMRII